MINTIFYFVSTYDTYKQQWDNGEISSKTIVFIEDIKAIYKNNKRYGSMSDPDLYTKFEQFYNSTYDDSDLRDLLARVEGLINDESNRLSGVIRDLDSDIQDKVTDMFDDDEWVRNNVVENTYLHQNMNWDDQIHAYLQQVGYWTTDDQGNTITQWSKIQLKVNSIDSEVSALSLNVLGEFTALQSSLSQQINTELQTAKTEIGNTYARGTDIDGVKKIIEWMYSGLKSSVSPSMSYAAILAAALNEDSGAISDLRTQVDYINGNYISTASLTTQVETYKNQIVNILSTAGVITNSSLETSQADLFSRLSTVEGQISGTGGLGTRVSTLEHAGFIAETNLASKIADNKTDIIGLAGLATSAQIDGLGNTYLAKANLITEIANNAGLIASLAGLLLTSDLDTAVANLVANTSSTSAAISVIATGALSAITMNAENINIDADHTLALDSQYVTLDSGNIYTKVNENLEVTANKISLTSQLPLALTTDTVTLNGHDLITEIEGSVNINADQITATQSHPLNLAANSVTINNQPFFDAIENRLDVGTVVTDQLESGTGTFKGNVEAKTFTAGSQGETGIVVQSGSFNPTNADTSKMYFAYDPSQNAPNLYVYDNTPDTNNNNNPVGWRCLSFANALTTNEFFASPGWYAYSNNGDNYIKKTDTTLNAADFTPVTLYIGHDDNRYYTYDSTANPEYTYASGYYYYKYPYDTSAAAPYDNIESIDSIVAAYSVNNIYSGSLSLQYLYFEDNDRQIATAEIHTHRYVGAPIQTNDTYTGYYVPSISSPIHMQNGITKSSTASDCVTGPIWYSNDAVLSFTRDPSTGRITSITRGFAFLKTVVPDSNSHGTFSQALAALANDEAIDAIGTIVSSSNNVYSCQNVNGSAIVRDATGTYSDTGVNSNLSFITVANNAGDSGGYAQHDIWEGDSNYPGYTPSITLSYTIPSAA